MPDFTTPQREWKDNIAFPVSKIQTTYGTALAFADVDNRAAFKQAAHTQRVPSITTNRDQFGKGTDASTNERIVAWDTRTGRAFDCSARMAAWIVSMGMGKVVTTGVGPYVHVLTFADPATSSAAPVTTWYEEFGAGDKARFSDMAVNQFVIQGRSPDELQISVDFVGSGRKLAGAHSALPAFTPDNILIGGDTTITIDSQANGSPADFSERVLEWSVTVGQTLSDQFGYHPGSGQFRGRIWYGRQQVAAAIKMFDDGTGDLQALADGRTMREININTAFAAGEYVNIKLPAVKLREEKGSEGGMNVYSMAVQNEDVFQDGSGTPDEMIEITVGHPTIAALLQAA